VSGADHTGLIALISVFAAAFAEDSNRLLSILVPWDNRNDFVPDQLMDEPPAVKFRPEEFEPLFYGFLARFEL
jgi:hypothetical protein